MNTLNSLTDAQLGELYDRWQRIKAAGGPLITHERIDWIVEKLRRSSYIPSWKERALLDYARAMGLAALKRADIDTLNDIARKALSPVPIWEEGGHDNEDSEKDSEEARSKTQRIPLDVRNGREEKARLLESLSLSR